MRSEMLMLWTVSWRREDLAERESMRSWIWRVQSTKLEVSCCAAAAHWPPWSSLVEPDSMSWRCSKKEKRLLRQRSSPRFSSSSCATTSPASSRLSSGSDSTADWNRTCLTGSSSSEFFVTTCLNCRILGEALRTWPGGNASSWFPDSSDKKDREVAIPTKLSGSLRSVKFSLLVGVVCGSRGVFSSGWMRWMSDWPNCCPGGSSCLAAECSRKWTMRLMASFMRTSGTRRATFRRYFPAESRSKSSRWSSSGSSRGVCWWRQRQRVIWKKNIMGFRTPAKLQPNCYFSPISCKKSSHHLSAFHLAQQS